MSTPHLSRRLCLLSGLVCATGPLWAQTALLPWREAVAGLQTRGTHHFRYWGLSIYHAELQVATGFEPPRFVQHRFALNLTYTRNFKGLAIADRTISEMQTLAQRSGQAWEFSRVDSWQRQLRTLIPDVQSGDLITGLHLPMQGTALFLNKTPLGTVKGVEFAELFFGIWLSPLSAQPAMRQALLAT